MHNSANLDSDYSVNDLSQSELIDEKNRRESGKSLGASLYHLEELLEALIELKGKDSSKSPKMETLLSTFNQKLSDALEKNPSNAKNVVSSFADSIVAYANRGDEQKALVIDEIAKISTKYLRKNPNGVVTLFSTFQPIFTKNNEEDISGKLKEFQKKSQDLTSEMASSKSDDSSNSGDVMGLAMYYLSMVQQAEAKFQGDQNTSQESIGKALIQAATNALNQLTAAIKKQQEEEEAAQHRPWWEKLVSIVIDVVSCLAAVCTGGLAVGIAVAATTVFMESEEGQKLMKELGDKIGSEIGGKFLMALIVTAAAVAIGGIGQGISALGKEELEDVAKEGLDEAASEATDQAVDGGAEKGASEAGKAGKMSTKDFLLSKGVNMKWFALTQILNTTAQSGGIMSAFGEMSNKKLAAWLGGVCTFLVAIAAGGAGYKAISGNLSNMLPKIMSMALPFLVFSLAAQLVGSGVGAYASYKQGEYFGNEAKYTEEIGKMEAALQRSFMNQNILQDTEKSSISASSIMTKSAASEMNIMDDMAGSSWSATDRVLAG